MATGGSYNPSTFAQKTPFETWAQVQGIGLYWDTENQFAAGKQGVSRARFRGPGATEGTLNRASGSGVNVLGGYGQRQITVGGRDYGSQALDRGELDRVGSIALPMKDRLIKSWEKRQGNNKSYSARKGGGPSSGGGSPARGGNQQLPPGTPFPPPATTPTSPFLPPGVTPNVPAPPGTPSMIPPPPQPKPFPAPTVPTAASPTPHPLATSNWREEQAHRITDYELGEPGQPTPDVSLGSRIYQQQVAERRASQQSAGPGRATSSERLQRASELRAQRDAERAGVTAPSDSPATTAPTSRAARRPSGLGPAGREIFAGLREGMAPPPTSPVGDQSARLMAEGTVAPGGPEMATETETRGVRSLTRPLTQSLTRPLTNTPTGSGGATAQRGVPEGRSTARSPRRKR